MNTTDDTVSRTPDEPTGTTPNESAAPELGSNDLERYESFRTHISAEHLQAPPEASGRAKFIVESRLTVSASWMRSSFENAQRALPIQAFPVKGFRPGKAPKQLIEKQRRERAIELARTWVVEDLRRFLEELIEVLVFSPIGTPTSLEWAEPDAPLTAVFRFEGWCYPHLDIDALCNHLHGVEPNSPDLPDRLYEYLSSKLIPEGIETSLMQAEEIREALPEDQAQAVRHIREALANNLLAHGLDIFITDEDLDRGYGEYAIEHSLSLLEAKEELEPVLGVFIQKIETEKAYAVLRERLKKK